MVYKRRTTREDLETRALDIPARKITIDNILYQFEQHGGTLDKEAMKSYIFEYACRMCEYKKIRPADNVEVLEALMKFKLEQIGNYIIKIMAKKKCDRFDLDLDEDCYKNMNSLIENDIKGRSYTGDIVFHINLYKK